MFCYYTKRFIWPMVVLLIISLAISILGYSFIVRFPGGAGLMEDDSYFYAQIAYNIGTNHISSFDGVNITDGYHLLWGWLLGLISLIIAGFTENKDIHLMGMLTCYFFVGLLTAYFFGKSKFEKFVLFFFTVMYSVLMETPLLTLMLMIFIHFYLNEQKNAKSNYLKYLAITMVPVIRIDSFIVITMISLFYLKTKRLRDFAAINFCLAIGLAIHFSLMKFLFGHYSSVSSLVKTSSIAFSWGNLSTNFDKYTVIFLFLFILALLSNYCSQQVLNKEKLSFVILALFLYTATHLVLNNNIRFWYYIPSYIVFSYVIFRSADKRFYKVTVISMSLLVAGVVSYKSYYNWQYSSDIAYSSQFVNNVKRLVPEKQLIYQFDGSGFIGYLSGKRVVNGDGLVNSHRYFELRKKNELENYLTVNKINYVITNNYINTDEILNVNGLIVTKEDVVPLLLPPQNLKKLTAFALYKLKNDNK